MSIWFWFLSQVVMDGVLMWQLLGFPAQLLGLLIVPVLAVRYLIDKEDPLTDVEQFVVKVVGLLPGLKKEWGIWLSERKIGRFGTFLAIINIFGNQCCCKVNMVQTIMFKCPKTQFEDKNINHCQSIKTLCPLIASLRKQGQHKPCQFGKPIALPVLCSAHCSKFNLRVKLILVAINRCLSRFHACLSTQCSENTHPLAWSPQSFRSSTRISLGISTIKSYK